MEEIVRQRMLSQAYDLILRALFAWSSLTIFACGLFGIWWPLAVIMMIVCLIGLSFMIWRDIGVSVINWWLITPTIKTNNRWLAWMIGLTTTTLLLLIFFTPMGGHQLQETVQSYASGMQERREQDTAERIKNAREKGEPKTNRELGLESNSTTPTLETPPIRDLQRETWEVRALCFIILLVLTVIYTFFAFWDEFQDALHAARVKLKEKAEGDITKAVINASMAAAPAVATKGASLFQDAAKEVGTQLAWDTASDWFKRIWRRR